MNLLSTGQALGLFAVCALALVILFLLRRKSKRIVVASLVPWRLVVKRRVNPLWRALIALMLQILSVALGCWALLAGPETQGELAEAPTFFVVDTSASMGPRLQALPERVLGSPAGLVAAGEEVSLVFAPGSSVARQQAGLLRVQAGQTQSLREAVTLAQSLGARPLVLSDQDPGLDVPWELLGQGVAGDLAVLSVQASAGPGLPPEIQVVVQVANNGSEDAEIPVLLRSSEQEIGQSTLMVPAGQSLSQGFVIEPIPGTWLSAEILVDDPFPSNNVAFGLLPQVRPARVRIVSDAPNRYLRDAFGVMPGVELQEVSASRYVDPQGSVDLLIFDRVAPRRLPQSPALYIDPPQGAGPFPPVGVAQEPAFTTWDFSHPLLDGVALRHVEVEQLSLLEARPGARLLAASAEGPVALVRDEEPKAVVLGFDVTRSDLPLTVAFPQLLYKMLIWSRQGMDTQVSPSIGTDVGIALDPGAAAQIRSLTAEGVWTARAGTARLGGLPAGVYAVQQGTEQRLVALNLPAGERPTLGSGDARAEVSVAALVPGGRPAWVWLVLAAGALLLVEFAVAER